MGPHPRPLPLRQERGSDLRQPLARVAESDNLWIRSFSVCAMSRLPKRSSATPPGDLNWPAAVQGVPHSAGGSSAGESFWIRSLSLFEGEGDVWPALQEGN